MMFMLGCIITLAGLVGIFRSWHNLRNNIALPVSEVALYGSMAILSFGLVMALSCL